MNLDSAFGARKSGIRNSATGYPLLDYSVAIYYILAVLLKQALI